MSGVVGVAQEAALARIDRAEAAVDLVDERDTFARFRAAVGVAPGAVDPVEACRLAAADAELHARTAVTSTTTVMPPSTKAVLMVAADEIGRYLVTRAAQALERGEATDETVVLARLVEMLAGPSPLPIDEVTAQRLTHLTKAATPARAYSGCDF